MTEMDELAARAAAVLQRTQDGIGTLPARESVKLRPRDWHACEDLLREIARRPSLSPAGVTEEQVEAAAKRIFEHWQFTKPIPAIPSDGVPAWVEGGNSLMQDKARAFARAALEAAAKAQPRDCTDFDTWFHEQEGTSLRSERFNGDVEWLKAAFDAGRSAQPSISTGQGEAEGRVYLIRKSGAWYRPQSQGYTYNVAEAGRFTRAEAEKITHPNGPSGPRDGLSFIHQNEVAPSLPAGHVAVPVSITREHAEAIYNALRQPLGIAQFTGHSITLIQNAVNDVLASLPHNQGEGK